tara:strand:+ start:56 stop:661 length:606 start_codon:yes stop_codon:yes gene_type:complete
MKILNKNQITDYIENIKVVDNFFTNECLEALKHRMLFAKYFDKTYNDYVAIDYFPTEDYLTDLIVSEINKKFDVPKFQRGWSFLYTKNRAGVGLHCDPSIINLNIWVSSNDSVLDLEKNGLHIYKITPPKDWTREDWNNNAEKSLEYIKSNNVEPVKIKYKSNRAIFFDGSYFHKTNEVSMKEGFENMRISYTLLFGNNLE